MVSLKAVEGEVDEKVGEEMDGGGFLCLPGPCGTFVSLPVPYKPAD